MSLLTSLHARAPLQRGSVVVESTSGNLGLALARLLRRLDCSFIAVIDPKTPPQTVGALRAASAEIVVVNTPDGRGGYLLERLAHVRKLCRDNPTYRWPNQYDNPANPAVHATTTGPEIVAQAPGLTAVYVPVSTGGTLAGVSAFLRRWRPQAAVVAVDALGSSAIEPTTGVRVISGIGMSRRSSFLGPGSFDRVVHVADADAIAVCRLLGQDLGLRLGGSSGSAVAAMLADIRAGRADGTGPDGAAPFAVCLCADGGQRYSDTIYADDWLSAHDLSTPVAAALTRFRADGLDFTWERHA